MRSQYLLKVSLHGMSDRMKTMTTSYLELNCNGLACVVDDNEAEAEIIDVDLSNSSSILQQRLEQQPAKPIIALSLYNEVSEVSGVTVYVKKPIEKIDLVGALNKVRIVLAGDVKRNKEKSSEDALKQDRVSSTVEVRSEIKNKVQPKTKESIKLNKVHQRDLVTERGIEKESDEALIFDPEKNERQYPDVDKFLKEFNGSDNKIKQNSLPLKKEKNQRGTVRYEFQAIKGCVKKKSFWGGVKDLPVSIETVSSSGALIKTKNKRNLKGSVVLEIQLDSQKVFIIPAKISRKRNSRTYGVTFLNYQHKLTEYLIDSGHSFSIF